MRCIVLLSSERFDSLTIMRIESCFSIAQSNSFADCNLRQIETHGELNDLQGI